MSYGDRDRIIVMISEKLDFDFSEEDLSPKLRREIGQIARKMDDYDMLAADADETKSRARTEIFLTPVLIIIGVVLLWFWIGVIFIVAGFLCFWIYTKEKAKAKSKEVEATSLWSDLDNRIGQLAKLVYDELSLLHEARIRPIVKHIVLDFANIIQAARGRGIILTNIECPYCNGIVEIPSTGEYFKCQYCGKTIHATKIFDKLKDILTPTE